MSNKSTLVLGGARAGKSTYAENLAEKSNKPLVYVATGQGKDDEMAARILAHQVRRGENWSTIEEPLDVVGAISSVKSGHVILLDCITLWISNLMAQGRDVETEVPKLCDLLGTPANEIIIVSNEVGLGIVPDNELARRFRDEAGRANQMIAQACDRVVFVAAGLPLAMKGKL